MREDPARWLMTLLNSLLHWKQNPPSGEESPRKAREGGQRQCQPQTGTAKPKRHDLLEGSDGSGVCVGRARGARDSQEGTFEGREHEEGKGTCKDL